MASIWTIFFRNGPTPEPEPIFFKVRSPEENFVGRLAELMLLENATITSSNSSAGKHIIVVSGLGGIGKTQLIRKFIEKNRASYKNVIWINSESCVTIMDSFAKLAEMLQIPTTHPDGKGKDLEFIVELVVNRLSKTKTLIVYDNVDKIEDVKFLLTMVASGTQLDVFITSRIRDWGNQINVVQLNVWEIDDAILYVTTTLIDPDSSHKDSHDDKTLLAQTLQAFPLALKQATAHINYQREAGTFRIADYIENYSTQEMLDSKLFLEDAWNIYEKTTFTTWSVTIDAIKQHGASGQLAVRILQMIAFFEPDDIHRDIFKHLIVDEENVITSENRRSPISGEQENRCITFFLRLCRRQEVQEIYNEESQFLIPAEINYEEKVVPAVRLLVRYSMVDSQQMQSILSVHRLVQKVIKLELEKTQHREKSILRDCLLLIVKLLQKDKIRANHSHAVSVVLSALKFNDLVEEFSQIPNEILCSLINSGQYNRAKEFGDKILKSLTDILGEGHGMTALTKRNFASLCGRQGKHNKKLQMHQDVFEKRKNILGENHPDTLLIEHEIANLYGQLGKHTEALQLSQDVFEKRKKILGENHPDTLLIERNIANLYGQLGKYTESLQMSQDVLEKHKNILGEDHPDTLLVERNIVNLYAQLGKHGEALQMSQDVLEKHKNILGENHPDTLLMELNIANLYGQLGKNGEALEMSLNVFEKHKDILGEDHPQTFTCQHSIASLYGKLGYHVQAIMMFQDVLTKQKQIKGEDHQMTLISKYQIQS